MDELSWADFDPSAQTIELSDSLDLSRLNCSPEERETIANVLVNLASQGIDCAHTVVYSSDNSMALLCWRFITSKNARVLLTNGIDLKTNHQTYGFHTETQRHSIEQVSFAATVRALFDSNKNGKGSN